MVRCMFTRHSPHKQLYIPLYLYILYTRPQDQGLLIPMVHTRCTIGYQCMSLGILRYIHRYTIGYHRYTIGILMYTLGKHPKYPKKQMVNIWYTLGTPRVYAKVHLGYTPGEQTFTIRYTMYILRYT